MELDGIDDLGQHLEAMIITNTKTMNNLQKARFILDPDLPYFGHHWHHAC